jgi:hypothetical protein
MIMSYTGKGINLSKFDKFNNNVELKSDVIELALDFTKIQATIDKELKIMLANDAKLQKIAPAFKAAKESALQYQNIPARQQKDLDAYYKDYAKKALELGIDVKTTQFFQEYLKASQLVGQGADAIENSKLAIKGL